MHPSAVFISGFISHCHERQYDVWTQQWFHNTGLWCSSRCASCIGCSPSLFIEVIFLLWNKPSSLTLKLFLQLFEIFNFVHPKIQFLSPFIHLWVLSTQFCCLLSFIYAYVNLNLYDLLSSAWMKLFLVTTFSKI